MSGADETAKAGGTPQTVSGGAMAVGQEQAPSSVHWIAPVLVALIGAFMSMLDSSIVNVAIPTIMTVFGVDTATVQWVSTVYLLTLGVVVPLSGWLADRLGQKRLYMLSLAVFLVGSFFCSVSWNINALIVARVLQAMGGGMIMPTMMSMVIRMVPKEKFGVGMGIFGFAVLVAPAVGPTLGGYLVEYVDWRWIFTINLPIGVIGIFLSVVMLPEFPPVEAGKFDLPGALTAATGLFCLLLGLSKGADWGWSSEPTVLLFFLSFSMLALFVYVELTASNPLLELRLFKNLAFTMANLTIVVTMVGTYATLFFIPLFLQAVRGFGALHTGLLMMPSAVVSAVMMPVAGKLYDKLGPRPLVMFGVLLLAVAAYLFHDLSLRVASSTVTVWVALSGMVMAFTSMPTQAAGIADLPPELVGRAAAIRNIISRVSASFGIAILTSILTTRRAAQSAALSWSLGTTDPAVQGTVHRLATVMGGGARGNELALLSLRGIVEKQAFVGAMDDVFIVVAAFTLLALIPGFFLKRNRPVEAPRVAAGES